MKYLLALGFLGTAMGNTTPCSDYGSSSWCCQNSDYCAFDTTIFNSITGEFGLCEPSENVEDANNKCLEAQIQQTCSGNWVIQSYTCTHSNFWGFAERSALTSYNGNNDDAYAQSCAERMVVGSDTDYLCPAGKLMVLNPAQPEDCVCSNGLDECVGDQLQVAGEEDLRIITCDTSVGTGDTGDTGDTSGEAGGDCSPSNCGGCTSPEDYINAQCCTCPQ